MLVALCEFGLTEQNTDTRHYALGPAILHLAKVREAMRPLLSIIEPEIIRISKALGETVHFCVLSQNSLAVACVSESSRTIRVHINEGTLLPLHSSGAGIAFLSACDEGFLDRVLKGKLDGTTEHSLTFPEQIRHAVETARADGCANTDQIYEEDVCGIAMPLRDQYDTQVGVIGVATPRQRFTQLAKEKTIEEVRQSVDRLSLLL
jgi:DNA-binding IclR family transcriptional regulator